jgi:hypothetical protein
MRTVRGRHVVIFAACSVDAVKLVPARAVFHHHLIYSVDDGYLAAQTVTGR